MPVTRFVTRVSRPRAPTPLLLRLEDEAAAVQAGRPDSQLGVGAAAVHPHLDADPADLVDRDGPVRVVAGLVKGAEQLGGSLGPLREAVPVDRGDEVVPAHVPRRPIAALSSSSRAARRGRRSRPAAITCSARRWSPRCDAARRSSRTTSLSIPAFSKISGFLVAETRHHQELRA